MHDVLRAAFAESDIRLHFKFVPYGRAIQGTLDGDYAAITFAGTANSPNFLFVRNFVMINEVRFAVPVDSKWVYTGTKSLEKIRLGTPTGFRTGNPGVDAHISNPSTPNAVVMSSSDNPTSSQIANVERLLAGRIDALLCGSLAFRFIVNKMGIEDRLRLDPTPVAQFYNHIAFSPNYPGADELRKKVEERITRLKSTGTIAGLLNKYGLTDH